MTPAHVFWGPAVPVTHTKYNLYSKATYTLDNMVYAEYKVDSGALGSKEVRYFSQVDDFIRFLSLQLTMQDSEGGPKEFQFKGRRGHKCGRRVVGGQKDS